MKTFFAALMLISLGVSASAQSLKLPTLVYTGAMFADWSTTALSHPPDGVTVHETAPIINRLEANHPKLMYAVGASIDAASIYAIHKFIGKRHPKVATVVFYAGAAIRGTLAVRNARLNHQLSSQPAYCGPSLSCSR